METQIMFGTYNVPILTDHSLTASFTAPSLLPKEEMEKINISNGEEKEESDFDKTLKSVLSVPPPAKDKKK